MAPFRSAPNPAPDRLTDVLYRSLESALIKQCARRYDAGMGLRRDRVSADGTKMRMHLRCRGLARMPVRVVVTHVGGNVYDVLCAVEDGGARRFSYSRPGEGGTRLSYAPALGEKVATFLLSELEKRLGRMLLKGPTRPPRPASFLRESNGGRRP
jgi:hypothetical protein